MFGAMHDLELNRQVMCLVDAVQLMRGRVGTDIEITIRRVGEEPFDGLSKLTGAEITSALGGEPASQRRPSPDNRAVILSAAWPLETRGTVSGAVLVEQSTNQILSLQNNVLERLFGTTLVFFAILLGSALTMKIQYYKMLYEDASFIDALVTALVELKMLPSSMRKLEAL